MVSIAHPEERVHQDNFGKNFRGDFELDDPAQYRGSAEVRRLARFDSAVPVLKAAFSLAQECLHRTKVRSTVDSRSS